MYWIRYLNCRHLIHCSPPLPLQQVSVVFVIVGLQPWTTKYLALVSQSAHLSLGVWQQCALRIHYSTPTPYWVWQFSCSTYQQANPWPGGQLHMHTVARP